MALEVQNGDRETDRREHGTAPVGGGMYTWKEG